jgi:hypothetical protein
MKNERAQNQELLPNDEQGESIDVIKEQVLDLNDKFDYLVKLMIENETMQAKSVIKEKKIVEVVYDDEGYQV